MGGECPWEELVIETAGDGDQNTLGKAVQELTKLFFWHERTEAAQSLWTKKKKIGGRNRSVEKEILKANYLD